MSLLPEIGVLLLGLGFATSLLMVRGVIAPPQAAQPLLLARVQVGLCAAAFAALLGLFAVSDFSVRLVAQHSHSAKPLFYKLSGAWGNHEGSALLWALIHSIYAYLFAHYAASKGDAVAKRAASVIGALNAPTLLFVIATSNPFARLVPVALEGQGLNPLLQDPALAIHPPILYAGYVGFVVPFGIAAATLLSGASFRRMASMLLPWAFGALGFLTLGVGLGSWWAYRELGWGGWWFWDPVENASLLPWFAGLALTHLALVLRQQGRFSRLTISLALSTYLLSLFGSFLVRSGILTSVHSFAVDPERGIVILSYVLALLALSSVLFYLRRDQFKPASVRIHTSKELFILGGASIALIILAAILFSMLYPMVLSASGLREISVGAPYYNSIIVPLLLVMLVLLAAAPGVAWGKAGSIQLATIAGRYFAPAGLAAIAVYSFTQSGFGALAAGLVTGALIGVLRTTKPLTKPRLTAKIVSAHLAHLGVAIAAIGMVGSGFFSSETIVPVKEGDIVEFSGLSLRFDRVERDEQANFYVDRAILSKLDGDEPAETGWIQPERRWYPVADKTVSEAAIRRTLLADFYVTLGDLRAPRATTPEWALRLHHRPLIVWIWIGCLLAFLGMGLSAIAGLVRRPAAKTDQIVLGNAIAGQS